MNIKFLLGPRHFRQFHRTEKCNKGTHGVTGVCFLIMTLQYVGLERASGKLIRIRVRFHQR